VYYSYNIIIKLPAPTYLGPNWPTISEYERLYEAVAKYIGLLNSEDMSQFYMQPFDTIYCTPL